MNGGGCRRRVGSIIIALALSACAGGHHRTDEEGINAYPTNYKTDILAAMHVYLNDPTAIRDASFSSPAGSTSSSKRRKSSAPASPTRRSPSWKSSRAE